MEGDELLEQRDAASEAMDLLDARQAHQRRIDETAALAAGGGGGAATPPVPGGGAASTPPPGGLGGAPPAPPADDGRHPVLAVLGRIYDHFTNALTPADRVMIGDLIEAGGVRWLHDDPDSAGTRLAHSRRYSRPREEIDPSDFEALSDISALTKRGTPMEVSRERISARMAESPAFATMVDAIARVDDPRLMRMLVTDAEVAVLTRDELHAAFKEAVKRGQRTPEAASAMGASERLRTLADGRDVAMLPGEHQLPVYSVMFPKALVDDVNTRVQAMGADQFLNSIGLGEDAQMRRFVEGLDSERTAAL